MEILISIDKYAIRVLTQSYGSTIEEVGAIIIEDVTLYTQNLVLGKDSNASHVFTSCVI